MASIRILDSGQLDVTIRKPRQKFLKSGFFFFCPSPV